MRGELTKTQSEVSVQPGGSVAVPLSSRPPLKPSSARPTPIRSLLRWLGEHKKVSAGLAIVAFFVLVSVFGPIFVSGDPNAVNTSALLQSPSAQHLLGTTDKGQDVFTQLIAGSRASLELCFGAGALATLLSVVVGLLAGYFGGLADDILSLLTNIFLVIPGLPLAIVLASYIPSKGILTVGLVIVVTGWAWGARVLRAQTLTMRRRDFVDAARSCGESPLRIVFAEILPNEIAIVASSFVGTAIYAILAEVGLEFLGLGDVSQVSWGNMLFWAQNGSALLQNAWWWFVAPGGCIALLGAGLSLINFGIDELANPRLVNMGKRFKKVKARA